jgi:periplasmic protein CpxP/Spy
VRQTPPFTNGNEDNMTLTRTTKILTAALAVITLGLGSIALAQPEGGGGRRFGHGFGHGRGGPGGPGGSGFPLRQLDLTDAQREQVKAIFDSHKDEFQAIGERLKTARQAQVAAIETQPIDETAIRAKTTELSAVEADAAVLRAKVHAAVFQVLTPEQQEKAKALKAEHEKRRAEMRERFQERRQQRQQQKQQANPANPPAAQL